MSPIGADEIAPEVTPPGTTLSDIVAAHAAARHADVAFICGDERMTWGEYDHRATLLALRLLDETGLERGARLGVVVGDGPFAHVAFLACARAGLVVVGIGPRAGDRETAHLLTKSGSAGLLTRQAHHGRPAAEMAADLAAQGAVIGTHLVVEPTDLTGPIPDDSAARLAGRPFADTELSLLNSTSGTTGLPKCVMHHEGRWFHFHRMAQWGSPFTSDDVFMSLLPAPFGFGLWTAHFTPAIAGAPCVVTERFTPEDTLATIEREHVTVLSAVSTQFIMLLNSPALERHDLTSLRVLYTGGEMVPYAKAVEFERRTGATVLQFYGSNETGALSQTTMRDDPEVRFRTAGRVIPEMQVRLFDPDTGDDVTASGGPAVAACLGSVNCLGYWDDPEANARLYTADGWMLTGDIVTIDDDGVLTVVGRASDFIIRGGKNISAAVVEDAVSSHPAVAMAAAVAMPDEVFGERVCVYAELRPGASITLDELTAHLESRGDGKELWPERLVVVDTLPRSSGGKVAKGDLRDDIRRRLAAEASGTASS